MENTKNNVSAVFFLLEAKVGGKKFLSVAELCYWWGGFVFQGDVLEPPFIQFSMQKSIAIPKIP